MSWGTIEEKDLAGGWGTLPEGKNVDMRILGVEVGKSRGGEDMATIEIVSPDGITCKDWIMKGGKGRALGIRKLIGMGVVRAPQGNERIAIPDPQEWVNIAAFSVYIFHRKEPTYDANGEPAEKIYANVDVKMGMCGYETQTQRAPDPAAPSEEEEREFERQPSGSAVDADGFNWNSGE